jgi:hypothetical protein
MVVVETDEIADVIECPHRSGPPCPRGEFGAPHLELDRRGSLGRTRDAYRIGGREAQAGVTRTLAQYSESQSEVERNVQWEGAALHMPTLSGPTGVSPDVSTCEFAFALVRRDDG